MHLSFIWKGHQEIVFFTDLFVSIKYQQITNLKGIVWLLWEGSFYLNLLKCCHNGLVRLNNFSEMFPFYLDFQCSQLCFSNN